METTTLPPVELSESECWVLLREALVGRLAVSVDDVPDVFPVNHVVDHGTLVFRTAAGTKLAATAGRPVAYEVDGYDPSSGQAWSVVLKGRAREVSQLHDVLETMDLPLRPWHASSKPRFVRVEPTSVTGRRFHTSVPSQG
ncbi:pyridoxamine 5'-phosphate oxidase family protein [Jannaschia sp. R86511]|uniref:pyridoxamine 5'-phosphate oxidase family protein n=1 Tax=Jannaschia sp. R86511 TaxID=3093853 RepID=UPI0036D3427D